MTRAYYINLDRVPDRAAHMEAELARAGLTDVERFAALDARSGVETPRYAPRSWGPYWTLTPTEVAVFESHRAVWTRILAENLSAAAVFEDDILAVPGLGTALADLAGGAHLFDVVKLDGAPGIARLGPEEEIGPQPVRAILQVLPSAAAYVLSAEGAEKLLLRSDRYCDHLDDFVMRPRHGWRAFQLMPARAVQGMFLAPGAARQMPGSLGISERTASTDGNTGYDRGPALYRLGKEARRAGLRLARRLWADRALLARGGRIGEVPLADGFGAYRS